MARARFTDCSTRITVVPWAWIWRTMVSSCSTMTGARPSDSSSMHSSWGRARKAMPSASICCWPPDRLAAGSSWRWRSTGNRSSTWSVRARSSAPLRRSSQPATRRFSPTVRLGNTPWPPGTWVMPKAAISLGGAWVMSRPSKITAPLSASTTPQMALSSVDLPAPLVPSRATISPSSISKSTSNSTCTLP